MTTSQNHVRYIGRARANIDYHHGQLRPAVGVHSYQVLRVNRSHPEFAEAYGWTYNHAPMLAHWRGRFYLSYLSNPVGEHTPPGQTLLATSADGRAWERPQVVFPPYVAPDGVYPDDLPFKLAPGSYSVMHQRMGFYVAPDGRLLALGFYGICPHPTTSPNDGRGIGRVVREVYADGALGPIHFVRYNRHAGWHEGNTRYPFYTASPDAGFIGACDALLADRLVTLQWWEEDRAEDGFFAIGGGQALSYYHAADGRVVGLWKRARVAYSGDEGQTWSEPEQATSLVMDGAKVWGQRTADGRYALVYNPSTHSEQRWPLAIVTGDDGYTYDDMLLVQGEVPPRRYGGHWKDFGAQYVRGIVEGNGAPPDGGLWLTYSMNKEDIWVSRVTAPVRGRVQGPVNDTLDTVDALAAWNLYSPQWAPVSVGVAPDGTPALALRDEDPYDYAKAERVFPDSRRVTLRTRVLAAQVGDAPLYIELADERGQVPVRLWFDADGRLKARDADETRDLGVFEAGRWHQIEIAVDAVEHRYTLSVPELGVVRSLLFDASTWDVQRIIYRTGSPRRMPFPEMSAEGGEDLPGADERVAPSVYYVASLETSGHAQG
jgi:hypothetical protein